MTALLPPVADNEGSASLILSASDLPRALMSLPQSYRVLHSEQAEASGEIVLRVASTDIRGHDCKLLVDVSDAGSTRTVRLIPARPDRIAGKCG